MRSLREPLALSTVHKTMDNEGEKTMDATLRENLGITAAGELIDKHSVKLSAMTEKEKDIKLVQRVQSGDKVAFELLLLGYFFPALDLYYSALLFYLPVFPARLLFSYLHEILPINKILFCLYFICFLFISLPFF